MFREKQTTIFFSPLQTKIKKTTFLSPTPPRKMSKLAPPQSPFASRPKKRLKHFPSLKVFKFGGNFKPPSGSFFFFFSAQGLRFLGVGWVLEVLGLLNISVFVCLCIVFVEVAKEQDYILLTSRSYGSLVDASGFLVLVCVLLSTPTCGLKLSLAWKRSFWYIEDLYHLWRKHDTTSTHKEHISNITHSKLAQLGPKFELNDQEVPLIANRPLVIPQMAILQNKLEKKTNNTKQTHQKTLKNNPNTHFAEQPKQHWLKPMPKISSCNPPGTFYSEEWLQKAAFTNNTKNHLKKP